MSDFKPKAWSGATRSASTVGDIEAFLVTNPGWSQDGQSLTKTYRFVNHFETMAFVNAVAWIAHRQDHHPTQTVGYNTVALRWDTHDVKGISATDFDCARACDALLTA